MINRFFILVTTGLFIMSTMVSFASSNEGEFIKFIKESKGEHYCQPEFKLVDPKGDAFLMRKLDQVPGKLVNALIKDDYREEDIDKEEEIKESYDIGKKASINPDRLINKIRESIQENPQVTLTPGQEHTWSPDAKKYMYYGFWHRLGRFVTGKQEDFPAPLLLRSKLFLLLACGYTSRYSITGKEDELTQLVMTMPDKSQMLHNLFQKSYLINNGNMYLTYMTLENVLAGNPYIENRADQPLQKKLTYLRNDSEQVGDNYGAWYHFHGLCLYGLVRKGVTSRFVAEVESLGSLFLEGFDKQEDYINRNAAIFSKKLRNMVEEKTYLLPLGSDDRTDYMTQDEFDHSDKFKAKLLISEVSSNENGRFIEIFCKDDGNNGDGTDIYGLKICFGKSEKIVTIDSQIRIKTNEYYVIKTGLPQVSTDIDTITIVTPDGTPIDGIAFGSVSRAYLSSDSSKISSMLKALYNSRQWVSNSEASVIDVDTTVSFAISRSKEMSDTDSMLDWASRQTITPGGAADFSHEKRDKALYAEEYQRQTAVDIRAVENYCAFAEHQKKNKKIIIFFTENSKRDETKEFSNMMKQALSGGVASGQDSSSDKVKKLKSLRTDLAKIYDETAQEFSNTSFFRFMAKAKLQGRLKAVDQCMKIAERFEKRAVSVNKKAFASKLDFNNIHNSYVGSVLKKGTLVQGVPTSTKVYNLKGEQLVETGEQVIAEDSFIGYQTSEEYKTLEALVLEDLNGIEVDPTALNELIALKKRLLEYHERFNTLLIDNFEQSNDFYVNELTPVKKQYEAKLDEILSQY